MNKMIGKTTKATLLTALFLVAFQFYGRSTKKINPIDFDRLNGQDCTNSKDCHIGIHENKNNSDTVIFTSKYKSKNNKYYLLTEDCTNGFSNATLTLKTYGFDNDIEKNLAEGASIQEAFLFDLDKDGTEEFYIQTEAGASGAEKMLLAFTADPKNNMLTEIKFIDLKSEDRGRRGYEYFSIKNERLYMSYPVYKKNDANCCPSGGDKNIEYKLYTTNGKELRPQ